MLKRIVGIGIGAILIISITLFILFQYPSKSFEQVLGTNKENITRIVMRSGNNGNYVETTQNDKISELIELLNNRYFHKILKQDESTGYSFYYDFYSEDKHLIRITGAGNTINIDGSYYTVSKSIDIDLLSEWFNSLPIQR